MDNPSGHTSPVKRILARIRKQRSTSTRVAWPNVVPYKLNNSSTDRGVSLKVAVVSQPPLFPRLGNLQFVKPVCRIGDTFGPAAAATMTSGLQR
jgi:hypothetical protein